MPLSGVWCSGSGVPAAPDLTALQRTTLHHATLRAAMAGNEDIARLIADAAAEAGGVRGEQQGREGARARADGFA